jgi:protein SCO1/2
LTASPSNRRWWLIAAASLFGCKQKPALPVFRTVPPFVLTDQNGSRFESAILTGKIWLASFFFTSCAGPCPRLNTALHDLQEKTYGPQAPRLVSFTVDPAVDTPEVLAAYARRYKADTERWVFLTGPLDIISHLARDAFQVGAIDNARTHSTRVFLIDKQSRVRGSYRTDDPESFFALLRNIRDLIS